MYQKWSTLDLTSTRHIFSEILAFLFVLITFNDDLKREIMIARRLAKLWSPYIFLKNIMLLINAGIL